MFCIDIPQTPIVIKDSILTTLSDFEGAEFGNWTHAQKIRIVGHGTALVGRRVFPILMTFCNVTADEIERKQLIQAFYDVAVFLRDLSAMRSGLLMFGNEHKVFGQTARFHAAIIRGDSIRKFTRENVPDASRGLYYALRMGNFEVAADIRTHWTFDDARAPSNDVIENALAIRETNEPVNAEMYLAAR